MKRIALIAAAAAALAAPAVFAQSAVIVSEPASHVLNFGSVPISPPVDGLPGSVVILSTPVAIDAGNTAILGGPAASFSSSAMTLGATAVLDVPNYATSRPDFKRWLAWEGSQMIR